MTKFSDIKDGAAVSVATTYGAIYTCHCGWIDLGHANPKSRSPFVGAENLWAQINGETGERSANGLWHRVRLNMTMSTPSMPLVGRVTTGIYGDFAVRLGLDTAKKESVALSIFLRVSHRFELLQGTYFLDSSFSGEDLVSNLLGFYRAVRGLDYVTLCKPVSKSAAEAVWTTYGAPGDNSNRTTNPDLYPCKECAGAPSKKTRVSLPAPFTAIPVVALGTDYREWHPSDPALMLTPPTPTPAPTPAPTPPPAAAPAPPPKPDSVPVVKGTTLSGIAADKYQDWRYWPLLWDANRPVVGSNPNLLKIGISISVPPLAGFTAQQKTDAIRRAPSWKLYPY
ncbi:MAG TPA: hypothetical protein VD970_15585 [Acetobacteraceae bacterium]|nr:hypothetical protein [Acetobacteraceae bacterium]